MSFTKLFAAAIVCAVICALPCSLTSAECDEHCTWNEHRVFNGTAQVRAAAAWRKHFCSAARIIAESAEPTEGLNSTACSNNYKAPTDMLTMLQQLLASSRQCLVAMQAHAVHNQRTLNCLLLCCALCCLDRTLSSRLSLRSWPTGLLTSRLHLIGSSRKGAMPATAA